MVLTILNIIFFIIYACLILYYLKAWRSVPAAPAPVAAPQFLSVIVAARNEAQNLPVLLRALRQQSLSPGLFEVLVVDDHSSDGTPDVVRSHAAPNVFLLRSDAPEHASSKKKAIATGIAHAKGTLIVTTDADCIPGPYWLQSISDCHRATDASFIAAPVRLLHDGSLLQLFQSLDFLSLQGITAAGVSSDFHDMCNGANLAYTRAAFDAVRGFENIDHIATGDDMLLMHKIRARDRKKIVYLKDRKAIMDTQPMFTWRSLIMQRRRWASKTPVYQDRRLMVVLGFVYLFNCLFAANLVMAFIDSRYWWLVLGFWIIKTAVELPFMYSVAGFYGERKSLRYFFFLQPLHIFYTIFVGLLSQAGRYEWKGRKTK